jgi:gliding motility-associated-like protein
MSWFKRLLTFAFSCIVFHTYAQQNYCPPPNIGFENGTFQGWACDTGGISSTGVIEVIPTAYSISNRQTLIRSTTDTDEFGGFPQLCPYGGMYSVRLGNEQSGARAERLSYTFTVPAGAQVYALVYYYAVVFQNPKHADYQQPRFTVKTFDVIDNDYVNCASFDFVASSQLPGFKYHKPTHITDTAIYYKDWSPATINLEGYAGKQMRVEFTTNDCTLGGHFGYAYVDVKEDCNSPITGNSYCTGQAAVNLLAPGGFGAYTWYNADLSKQLSFTQRLTISPPPPDNTKYAVILQPYNGLGCTDTLFTTVSAINSGFTFTVQDTLFACPETGADLTAATVSAGSSSNLTYSYYTDALGTKYLFQPQTILKNGIYYIQAINPEGCTNILPVQVIIASPVLTVTNPAPVVYPATVDLSVTFPHEKNTVYTYYTDSQLTHVVSNAQQVAISGTYYIKAVSIYSCITVKPVKVVVNGPPPPVIKAVNTFTPNGDGLNDYFTVSIVGEGIFGSLRIYNRYGQLLYQTTDRNFQWNGTYKGKPLPSGVYYWVFAGINGYNNAKFAQGGEIMLIR